MAIGRRERFDVIKPRVIQIFGDDPATITHVAQVFELMEMAWHDCYGEVTPSEQIVDEILLCSHGKLSGLIAAAQTAVVDRRDLHVWAGALRAQNPQR